MMGDNASTSRSSGAPPNVPRPSKSPAYPEESPDRTVQWSGSAQRDYPSSPQHPSQRHTSQLRPDNFSMSGLGNALPEVSYQNYAQAQPQRYQPSASSSGMLFQTPNMQQYNTPQAIGMPANVQYNMPYQAQYQGMYGPSPSPPNLSTGSAPPSQYFQNQTIMGQYQPSPHYMMQQGQYVLQTPGYPGFPTPYASRNSYSADNRLAGQNRGSYIGPSGDSARSGAHTSATSQSSVVRGPPRKPKQSGHAIWIGNLPPQTELMDLVQHVCKEAPGLESLFLISKSNCAFANFRDESACAAAQAKIHDSKFQTVRLVSRLRRNSVATAGGVTAPTGPSALNSPNPPVARSPVENESSPADGEATGLGSTQGSTGLLPNDKFFIVKSLTVEDLELSVRNGIWATQSHNEEALNKAYESVENVYLIFSANKSGEYFGYAKMVSPINNDPAAAIEFAPKAQSVEDPELPKAIPTPVTEFAPKGRIIDDSARGTIFWEAERDETEDEDETKSVDSEQGEAGPPSKAWGKPFKIEWLSTSRLPFYRTRGIRNPWNSNREVKIARDGTELETEVGRRLISLFHKAPSPTQSLPPVPMQPMGYVPMHPFP